jgi:hypothetical protein
MKREDALLCSRYSLYATPEWVTEKRQTAMPRAYLIRIIFFELTKSVPSFSR